jgi:hypothetical protein
MVFRTNFCCTLKGFEESAELMVEQQFTGLLGSQLWVLRSLTVELMPRDFPHFVQKSFQAQSLLNQLSQLLLKSVNLKWQLHRSITEVILLALTFQSPAVTSHSTMFNVKKLYVLPTQCTYRFCLYIATNSDYCPTQH